MYKYKFVLNNFIVCGVYTAFCRSTHMKAIVCQTYSDYG